MLAQPPRYWDSINPVALLLWPVSLLFRAVAGVRRWAYQNHYLARDIAPVPVIVVGNINVGGSGKTPLVVYLIALLRAAGYRPGIISRGYGGRASSWPQTVSAASDPAEVGDEPVLLAQRCRCPIVVAPKRIQAAQTLLRDYDCDVIVSDDGLQHYALQRDIEIAVIHAQEGFGNGWLLPAGPLREPVKRLQSVDLLVCSQVSAARPATPIHPNTHHMTVHADQAVNLARPEQQRPLSGFAGQTVHALAGIARPQRFFDLLSRAGIRAVTHPFADHYRFRPEDLDFDDDYPILLTEKDAVKCRPMASARCWYVPISAQLDSDFDRQLLSRLQPLRQPPIDPANEVNDGQKTA